MDNVPSAPAPQPSPGYLQLSYWLSLVGVAVTVLVVVGVIPATEQATATQLLTDLLTKLFALVAVLIPFCQFLYPRLHVAGPRPSPDAKPAAPAVPAPND